MTPFDAMYEGSPPWEIGRPQPTVKDLLHKDLVRGRVLDIGCGSGENAMMIAAEGLEVVAIDAVPRAVELGRRKAQERDLQVRFQVHDVLEIASLRETFDTVIDSGLFHVFSDEGRKLYTRALTRVMRPGAILYLICFSDEEPNWGGPRRVTRRELRSTFGPPFAVESVTRTRYYTTVQGEGVRAWLATIVHMGKPVSEHN